MKSNSRILIISHNSFSAVHNNGKTFESIFKGFEKKNLAQLFFCSNEKPDFDYCENYFQITDKDVLRGFFCFYSKTGRVVKNESIENSDNNSKLLTFAKQKSSYIAMFRDILWMTRAWNTKQLRQWCNDFAPDAIFYVGGGSGFSHSIAQYISKILKKPLITYFTDDYLIFPEDRNILEIVQKWRMKRFYKKTVTQSSLLFTIGELMSKEYTKYFNREFLSIMNSVPITPYVPYESHDKITISYFGGIHLNRWKMIVRLAELINGVEFNVYTIQKPSQEIMHVFHDVGILYKGGLQGEELRQAIINSDILLHVESDDDYYKSLTKLSVSTKIPEYLMSGRIILGFGPSEVASMRVLSDNNIGVVIPSIATDLEIKTLMNEVIANYKLRYDVGIKGYNFAIKNFDNMEVVNKFTLKVESILNN